MNLQNFKKAMVTVALFSTTAMLATATPINGSFSFGGGATVNLTSLDFVPVGGGTGTIVTIPGPNTGSFAALNGGFTFGSITDRTDVSQPVGQPLSVTPYLTLAAFPTYLFTLELVLPGQFSSAQCFAAAANGQVCTVPPSGDSVSPYNLNNFTDATAGLSSSASFSVRGTVIDTSDNSLSNFDGVFTATFLGQPYQQTLGTVFLGGSVNVPFSATFNVTSAVPEPSSILLGLSGLAMIALVRRKK
ncbi:MAG: PEP-CTERM sorting domain-containing protein [Bryobacteraceae bacterium]|nr:PEP-CTERM sorting domain-containing protein [Bryobacteraceae bacterium]